MHSRYILEAAKSGGYSRARLFVLCIVRAVANLRRPSVLLVNALRN
jgi:hypothetical protein